MVRIKRKQEVSLIQKKLRRTSAEQQEKVEWYKEELYQHPNRTVLVRTRGFDQAMLSKQRQLCSLRTLMTHTIQH